MKEKKERVFREKMRRRQEDLLEEQRVKLEIENLNRYHMENRSEREEIKKDEEVLPLNSQLERTLKLNEKHSKDTKIISDVVNPSKIAMDKAMSAPLNRQLNGNILPPKAEEVKKQMVIEQKMHVFNHSIAQMRENHSNLIESYGQEMNKLRQMNINQPNQEEMNAQASSLGEQIGLIQAELEKIMQVIEVTGGNLIENQTPINQQPGRPASPPIQVNQQSAAGKLKRQAQDIMKKQKVLLSFKNEKIAQLQQNGQQNEEVNEANIDKIIEAALRQDDVEQQAPSDNMKEFLQNETQKLAQEQMIQSLVQAPPQSITNPFKSNESGHDVKIISHQNADLADVQSQNKHPSELSGGQQQTPNLDLQQRRFTTVEKVGMPLLQQSRQNSARQSESQRNELKLDKIEQLSDKLQNVNPVSQLLSRRSQKSNQLPPLPRRMSKDAIIVQIPNEPQAAEDQIVLQQQNEQAGINLDNRSHSDFKYEPSVEPMKKEIDQQATEHPMSYEEMLNLPPEQMVDLQEQLNNDFADTRKVQEFNSPIIHDREEQKIIFQSTPQDDNQNQIETVQEFIEAKKQTDQPIIIKKLHSNKNESQQNVEQGEKILVDNQIELNMFEQRSNLRNAIKQTDMKEPIKIDENNFFDAKQTELYQQEQYIETKQPNQGTFNYKEEMLYKSNGQINHDGRSINGLLSQLVGRPAVENSEIDGGFGMQSGIFTADKQINEYPKRKSFYEKQTQMQEIAFKKKEHVFGCYGPVEEQNEEANQPINLNYIEEDQFIKQKPVRYNKKDPFSVNLRLRQSLSNTNRILFKQDNQRYIESISSLNQEKIFPQSSLKKLIDLKKLKEINQANEPEYDDNLYRDPNYQSQPDEEGRGPGEQPAQPVGEPSVETLGFAGFMKFKENEKQFAMKQAKIMKKRVTFQDDVIGQAPLMGKQHIIPHQFDFSDKEQQPEQQGIPFDINQLDEQEQIALGNQIISNLAYQNQEPFVLESNPLTIEKSTWLKDTMIEQVPGGIGKEHQKEEADPQYEIIVPKQELNQIGHPLVQQCPSPDQSNAANAQLQQQDVQRQQMESILATNLEQEQQEGEWEYCEEYQEYYDYGDQY